MSEYEYEYSSYGEEVDVLERMVETVDALEELINVRRDGDGTMTTFFSRANDVRDALVAVQTGLEELVDDETGAEGLAELKANVERMVAAGRTIIVGSNHVLSDDKELAAESVLARDAGLEELLSVFDALLDTDYAARDRIHFLGKHLMASAVSRRSSLALPLPSPSPAQPRNGGESGGGASTSAQREEEGEESAEYEYESEEESDQGLGQGEGGNDVVLDAHYEGARVREANREDAMDERAALLDKGDPDQVRAYVEKRGKVFAAAKEARTKSVAGDNVLCEALEALRRDQVGRRRKRRAQFGLLEMEDGSDSE